MPADPTDPAAGPGPDTPTWTVDDDGWFVFEGRRVAVALCWLEPEPETPPDNARDALKADVRAARVHEGCGTATDTLRQARELAKTFVASTRAGQANGAAIRDLLDLLADGGGDG